MANIAINTEDFTAGIYGGSAIVTANTHAAPAFAGGSAGLADTLTDNSAALQMNKYQVCSKPTNDTTSWCFSIYVRKDSDTTRFATFSTNFEGGPGTIKARGINFNTATGATNASITLGAPASHGVVDVDANWWRIWMVDPDNATGCTQIVLGIKPAAAATLTSADDSTPVGAIVVWGYNISHDASVQAYDPHPFYTIGSGIGTGALGLASGGAVTLGRSILMPSELYVDPDLSGGTLLFSSTAILCSDASALWSD
jgi:hypothetical protein